VYESHTVPPISLRRFTLRLLRHAGYGGAVVVFSLVVGTVGFVTLAAQQPVDAFLNAAMLLGGMGPVGDLGQAPTAGKLFAAGFALYAGLVFLILAGLFLTPVFHRVLHRFHWERGRTDR